ncbi:Outer membrane receptor proteins, mostly Fe transport [Granulicella rosea]|uniref:Outer membrane receptor proteins, mostly Fe transport n=1 Tax=Granulicella rosea TaxID=474952 RepID=A0A239MLL6_9BACT|nr:TonB-dependent receptor [Granulicella rosea]SNT43370.1 Outer membrane receptor proteins, mostly Fe transport [Granulicella rosea]
MKIKGSQKAVTVAVCGLAMAAVSSVSRAQQMTALTLPNALPTATSTSPLPDAPMPAVKSAEPVAPRESVMQNIDVSVRDDVHAQSPDEGVALHATAQEVSLAAGAYNDVPRYLQTMPGVSFDTDARNTYLVNGGNAMENTFVLDGVEMPNINHISTNGSSGGFVSVIDTSAISDITLHKQLYGSEYGGTLSSVLDMHTRVPESDQRHGELDLGYAGSGFVLEQPIGRIGSTLTQYRHSIVNYLTNDIGLDGVPDYHSILSTSTIALSDRDTIKTLYLSSGDTLNISPNTEDPDDPNILNTRFGGNRSTGAVTWHRAEKNGGSDLQLNYSSVTSTTSQTSAYNNDAPVYSDRLNETPITMKYDAYLETSRVHVQGGFTWSHHSIDYNINQAQGFPTPYSQDPTPVDASNTSYNGAPHNYAVYGEGTVRAVGKLELQAGLRGEHWGINNSAAWMPRAGAKLGLGKRSFLFGGIGSYSQMPSLPIMLGYASNIGLKPMRNVQTQFGFSAIDRFGGHFMTTVYTRRYSDYPVSTQFTSLSLADMVDSFGQPYLYMPMVSAGRGKVLGFEAQYETNMKRRVFAQVNLTSRSVQHTALDGVWRRANYDMPILGNLLGGVRLSRRQVLTGRYSYHSGTPYTPFLLDESYNQQREIYDLSQVNAMRGTSYARMDLRYEINLPVRHKNLKIYSGMENVLGRSNFYQYVMLHDAYWGHTPYALTQMGRYMDGGMSWSF